MVGLAKNLRDQRVLFQLNCRLVAAHSLISHHIPCLLLSASTRTSWKEFPIILSQSVLYLSLCHVSHSISCSDRLLVILALVQFYVPIEIVEVIIDHLHNDKEALKACSLVSRRWVFSARYHLVYPIKLHHKNISDFLDLLQSPCLKIAPSIRDLSFLSVVEERNWIPSALSTVEKHLTHVKSLTLHGVRWSRLDTTTTTSFFRGFQSVTHLTIKAGAFSSFSQCVEFICSFPALTTLTANKCQWDSNTAAPPSPRFKLSRSLTTLAIDTPPNTLTQWLTNQPCARTLRKVSIEFIDTDHATSVRNFLRKIKARDVEAIRVGFKEIYGQRSMFCCFMSCTLLQISDDAFRYYTQGI